MRRRLLIGSLICSAVYLLFIASPNVTGTSYSAGIIVILKVLSIALLILLSVTSHPRCSPLIVALIASAFGDFFLGIPHLGALREGDLFMFGLGAFLLAHLWYISLFSRNLVHDISVSRKLGIVIVIAVLAVMLYVLWPQLGPQRIPVLIYALALDTMAITALASQFPELVAGGAMLFVASDAMLAMDHFGRPFGSARVLVWVSYYLAQLMITTGVIQHVSRSQSESPAQ